MKTLKKLILTLSFLLVACFLVKAESPLKTGKNANEVLIKYIANVTVGQGYDFKDLLAEDFIQYLDCERKELNYDKKQFIKYMKASVNTVFDCTTEYSVIEETQDIVIAKVDMHFANFTKSNYVTLSNTDNGWIITNISVKYS